MRHIRRFMITEQNDQSFCIMDKKTKKYIMIASMKPKTIYLEHLFIPEEMRRKAYGSYILNTCKRYMRKQGVSKIVANACPLGISENGLKQFYVQNGFNVSDYPNVIYRERKGVRR